MKAKAITVLLICGSFVVLWSGASCSAAEPPKAVKTDFAAGANLLPSELKQVVALAKQGGMADVAEVSTFHYVPGGGRGIRVKSAERVDDRNISFDSVAIHKSGWDSSSPSKDGVPRDGNFWCDADGKYTTLLRSYEFNKQAVKIEIGRGVDIAIADKVIPLIIANQGLIHNDSVRRQFEALVNSKPQAIYKGGLDGYELRFGEAPSQRSLKFRFDNGQVIITGVSSILI